MIEQIPQLDGETSVRARSTWAGYTLYFANIPNLYEKSQASLFSKRQGETCGLDPRQIPSVLKYVDPQHV
jgi:hypothetical protein